MIIEIEMFVDPDDSNNLDDNKPDDIVEDVLDQSGVHASDGDQKPEDAVEDVLSQTGAHVADESGQKPDDVVEDVLDQVGHSEK